MFGFLFVGRWQNRILLSAIAVMFVALVGSVCMAQVTAADFNGGLSANDFLGLAMKWEDRAEQADANSAIGLLSKMSVSDVYRECACDLKELLDTKKIRSEDLFVQSQQVLANAYTQEQAAQAQNQNFGQQPPQPQPRPEIVPLGPGQNGPTPYPSPKQAPQPTQKQVQAPVHGAPMQAPQACGVTWQQQPVNSGNWGSGGRQGLFGRRANGGGFRLFGRRGC